MDRKKGGKKKEKDGRITEKKERWRKERREKEKDGRTKWDA